MFNFKYTFIHSCFVFLHTYIHMYDKYDTLKRFEGCTFVKMRCSLQQHFRLNDSQIFHISLICLQYFAKQYPKIKIK